MVKHKDAMAKMIMDEMRESEEDPPNCPAGSARSEYSKSLEKKVLKEKSFSSCGAATGHGDTFDPC
ncbi:hypothetical protein CDL15_Pgr015044 [Punica granatum]|uniref:Uncharacterized protein n=1 Tax=Punica granatum TaxID=22663 RepID=A0A218WZ91_PUNGR|nr:hypothetical protein CDL15_Pgr015044 [Punica granatum]